jgi:hypothetical protein
MTYQRTHLLATAKVTDIDSSLIPTEQIRLASGSNEVRGQMPVVPTLENQTDLTKLVAILLSTGINRNDDVFLASEILPVRETGAHKPVNLEHDPKQIIGHMLRTFASEKDGSRIADNARPSNKSFDITAEAVLYSFLFPDLIEDIKDRADCNNLFVSVEVWFKAFDFLVGNKLVKRNSQTASQLEGRLKVNGGEGFFEGKRVGRVLRDMIIGGIGVVRDPANPESIIKSVSSFDSEVVEEIETDFICEDISCDSHTLDQTSKVDQVLEVELMNPKIIEEMAALASAIKAVAQSGEGSVDTESETVIDVENSQLQALASRIEVLEKNNKELRIKAEEEQFKTEATVRANTLQKAGIPDEMLERHLTRCFRMTKDQFDEYVGLLVDTVNTVILQTKASATTETEVVEQTTETTEGGDEVDSEVNAETETTVENQTPESQTDVVEETVDAVQTTTNDETSQSTDDEVVEEVTIDIEAVDPVINTEGEGGSSEPSLVEEMADVVQQYLSQRDEKWKKLALKD